MNDLPLKVIKRNKELVDFNPDKITVAVTKAFAAHPFTAERTHELSQSITKHITATLNERYRAHGIVDIETIQDQVELELMRLGEHKVARDYILYREEHAKARQLKEHVQAEPGEVFCQVRQEDGSERAVLDEDVRAFLSSLSEGFGELDLQPVFEDIKRSLYQGINQEQFDLAFLMAARTMIEKGPEYTYFTARLLLNSLYREASGVLGHTPTLQFNETQSYNQAFIKGIQFGVKQGLLDERLLEFDLERLSKVLQVERDKTFQYLGLQTLYDRYFLHSNDKKFELPQGFFMRVAMGLSLLEPDKNARAEEFYHLLSSFDFMCSTPTLFNSGCVHAQLSSCYLTTVEDDLHQIFEAYADNAMLSKWAGGLGNDWTQVRSMGARIKGTNGQSQGVVPFLKIANDTAVAVNQGGKRKGAVCAYLETWHMDIEEFLELRKNTGDERRRTHDMNSANWIPDLFMKRVIDEGSWTLFSPSDVSDLHDLCGEAFEKAYVEYERQTETGEITHYKRVAANDLWRRMLSMLFETGHPWITFKDPCNLRSPQQHQGVVHSSNLCTEITLNTSSDEVAVCNLGSVNLAAHISAQGLDLEKLRETVRVAVRMLDNVIDVNFYPIEKARRSNLRHRPVGLGLMGFQDALYTMNLPYASEAATAFADTSMEHISYFAIEASADLAQERGSYETFQGSLWSQGILPIDSQQLLLKARGERYIKLDTSMQRDWSSLRERVKQGIRNSNLLAIAPTATIANIVGVTPSIEPTYQNLYVKSNLSGEFTLLNPHMMAEFKEAGLWDEAMVSDLKYHDGSLVEIKRVPEALKQKYQTAFEVGARWIIESAARRQKWIDQSQSLNIYLHGTSGRMLDITYKMAWYLGLKTTYYLRAKAATAPERTTMEDSRLRAVPAPVIEQQAESDKKADEVASEALLLQPKVDPLSQTDEFLIGEPACSLDEDCDVCQ